MVLNKLAMTAILIAAAASGCARQPSNAKTAHLMKRHFMRYAKHYPTSALGQSRVSSVSVEGIEEIHKRFVSATGTVTFEDGRNEPVRCSIENRLPLGWRIVSWERLSSRSP